MAASGVTIATLGDPAQDRAAAAGKSTLTAVAAQARKCHEAPADRQRGVDGFDITATSTGLVRARLDPTDQRGRDSDWDVAVFDKATGRLVAASAGFRSHEVADGFVNAGDTLRVQGCRFAGNAHRVNVSVTFVAQPPAASEKAQLVAVSTPTRADKNELIRQDFDLTEAATDTTVDVILHGQADADRLRAAGFGFTVKIDDLADHIARTRESDRRYAAQEDRSDLPSGRTAYRRLADYDYEMKDLARRHPTLVKPITLAYRSIEGRDIDGIEITPNAGNTADGKPVFLNMGVHHAREWPSGESAMEWAYDLVNGYGRDQRTTRLVSATRAIVVPIVNPDGFSVSREATERGDAAARAYEYKRKNCSPVDAPTPDLREGLCPLTPAGPRRGTDLNRNYGGFWGGPGASTNWNGETYRGPAPFSEPEVGSIRELIAGRQVTNLITNHTYSNLVLRPPGVLATGDPVDEPLLYRLGEEMADKNGYNNIRSWQLYDTTGTTEDWSYWVTGGLGYTFEIGGTEFHPPFEVGVVAEYLGRAPAAGAGKGGNREAYFAMLESTANAAHHATITGRAPAGWTLRIHKEFQTPTSPVIGSDGTVGPALMYSDVLDSTLKTPGGQFAWHVNPSTRPYVAGRYGRYPSAPTQGAQPLSNPDGVPAENTGSPLDGPHEEIPFTVEGPPAADNGEAHVRIEWKNSDVDWDLYIVDAQGHVVGQSATGGTNFEDAVLIDPPPGTYRAVVVNYAQVPDQPVDDWTSPGVTFQPPKPPLPGVAEAWTLTCERPGGSIAAVHQVVVGRGGAVDLGDVCRHRK
ncbi:zinc carboxypeptidase [Planosporangium flavigriseum]|nr:zinc carboxypeptidase [Planosporangium flavigriseum]